MNKNHIYDHCGRERLPNQIFPLPLQVSGLLHFKLPLNLMMFTSGFCSTLYEWGLIKIPLLFPTLIVIMVKVSFCMKSASLSALKGEIIPVCMTSIWEQRNVDFSPHISVVGETESEGGLLAFAAESRAPFTLCTVGDFPMINILHRSLEQCSNFPLCHLGIFRKKVCCHSQQNRARGRSNCKVWVECKCCANTESPFYLPCLFIWIFREVDLLSMHLFS